MKQNDIFYILIPACILVFVWIAFNIQHNSATSTIPEATSIQIAPIIPSFDLETVESIQQRQAITPLFELGNNQPATNAAIIAPTETPLLEKIPIATESGQQATESAQ